MENTMKKKEMLMKKVLAFVLVLVMTMGIIPASTVHAKIDGYRFKYNGVTITMGSKAKKFINAAGTPKSTSKSSSCSYDGYDITRKYSDFILYTYTNSKSSGAAEYVSGITFLTKNVTVKGYGIKIGSKEKKVKKKLGNQTPVYGIYTYTKGQTKLQIEVKDKKVKNIRYLKI